MRHAEIKKKKTCMTRSQPRTANPDLMHTYLRSYTREREREGEGEIERRSEREKDHIETEQFHYNTQYDSLF